MTTLIVPVADEYPWPSLGSLLCVFMEANLVFGPGDLRGQRAVLDDEKRAFIWSMYEVFPQGHPQAGRRRFKRCALSLAKGLAKTEFAAWVAICELHPAAPVRCVGFDKHGNPLGGPVTDPYIPCVAYTEEQSEELVYGTVHTVVSEGPLHADFDIGLERIARLNGDGKLVALSAAPNARDGARTTFQVADETHWWTLPRLKQAHQTMMANLPKRYAADAWALEVTTAPEPGGNSVAEATMQYAQAVADGRLKDARLFFFHRQAGDEHDLQTEEGARAAVIEASGAAASWRDIDAIVELWRDPTTDRSYWERVWCNRLVRSADQAFDVKRWQSLAAGAEDVPDGTLITLGFDGARYHDATAIVATVVESGYQWAAGIWECPPGRDGDWEVPADEVEEVVARLFERFTVWRFQADPHFWEETLARWAGRFGKDRVVSFDTRGYKRMSDAIRAYTMAIETGVLSHDDNPVMTRHIGAAQRRHLLQLDETGQRMYVIQKERPDSPKKIDAAMAGVLSWDARIRALADGATAQEPEWAFGAR